MIGCFSKSVSTNALDIPGFSLCFRMRLNVTIISHNMSPVRGPVEVILDRSEASNQEELCELLRLGLVTVTLLKTVGFLHGIS